MQTISIVIGLIALLVMGWQDLRHRRVDYEWLYIIVILCGLFTGGALHPKLFCLIAVPLLLLFVAWRREKKTAKAEGRKPDIEHTLQAIGGADLKTLASAGFLCGPFPLAAALLLSMFLSIPFLLRSDLGVCKESKESREQTYQGKVPLVTLVSASLAVLYGILYCVV